MKKIFYFLLSLCSVLSYQLSVITPIFALSWQDYFPPIKLDESKRQPPDTAIAPEVVGGLDAYSNTLDKQVKCLKIYQAKKFWEPKEEVVGTDENGNPIKEQVAQDAVNLEEIHNLDRYVGEGFRVFQSFFAKGEIKEGIDATETSFKDMNISGSGAFNRINSINNLNVERSRYLMDVVESLKPPEEANDVVAQDVQIAWDCQDTVTPLSQNPKNCREITVSELLYGLQELPFYYTDDYTLSPTTFPADAIAFINSYYPNGYYSRFKKNFSKLSSETYLSMYQQLNAPKGNVNTKIKYTNYNKYDMSTGKAYDPVTDSSDRNVNAGSLASPQAKTINLVSSINTPPLPNSTDQDYCDDYVVVDKNSTDLAQESWFKLFAMGLFKHLAPGESYVHKQGFEMVYRSPVDIVSGARDGEKALINLIPADNIDKNKFLDEKFSSTTKKNEKFGVVNAFSRGSKIYCAYNNFLRPASWQTNDPINPNCPKSQI